MATLINTKRVANRRKIRFEAIDDALNDAQRMSALEQAGRLEQLGNWTLGQIIGHLATWVEFVYTVPPIPPPPLPVKLMLRLFKGVMLKRGMPVGVRLSGVEHGTLGTEMAETSVSLPRYQQALDRLRREPPTVLNIAFGPMTHEEAIKLNLRHAELHLSFVKERG